MIKVLHFCGKVEVCVWGTKSVGCGVVLNPILAPFLFVLINIASFPW